MPSVQSCTLQRVQGSTTFDENNFGHYTLKYDVKTDGVVGHKALASQALLSTPHALPNWGDTYSYQGDTADDAYAQGYTIESKFDEQSQLYYVITVKFEPLPDGDSSSFDPNPFLRPAIVWIDREVFTRLIERDSQGKAIVNKCVRLYDTTEEQEDFRGVIVVEFNVATLSTVVAYMRFLRRAVNSSPWNFGGIQFPSRSVVARDVIGSPPITEGAYTYRHMVFRFAAAEGDNTISATASPTWDTPYVERGYQCFEKDENGNIIQIFDPNQPGRKKLFPPSGEPELFLLAADGTRLPDGEDPVITHWRTYREVNFNLLPFSG